MSKSIEEILATKPEARPRIYAYSIEDTAHAGLLSGSYLVGNCADFPSDNGCQLVIMGPVNQKDDLPFNGTEHCNIGGYHGRRCSHEETWN